MIITGLALIYFWVAGCLFRDMIEDSEVGTLPVIGIFIISLLWLPMIVWFLTMPYYPKSRQLWEKIAGRLFNE